MAGFFYILTLLFEFESCEENTDTIYNYFIYCRLQKR